MNQKLLALYGLKWNPFTSEVPIEALHVPPKVENFCWRIEQAHLREGGFALIQGDPGTGKSVVMRLLAERLSRLADLSAFVRVENGRLVATRAGRPVLDRVIAELATNA